MAEPIGSLRAEISATAAKFSEDMAKIQARLDETNNSFKKFGTDVTAHGSRIEKQFERSWEKLTSGTEIVIAGMNHLRRAIEGLIVINAIHFIEEFIKEVGGLSNNIEKVKSSTQNWIDKASGLLSKIDPLILKTKEWNKVIYESYLIQFAQLKLDATKQLEEATKALKNQEEAAKGNLDPLAELSTLWEDLINSLSGKGPTEFNKGTSAFSKSIEQSKLNVRALRNEITAANIVLKAQPLSFEQSQLAAENASGAWSGFTRNLQLTAEELPKSLEQLLSTAPDVQLAFDSLDQSSLKLSDDLNGHFDEIANSWFKLIRSFNRGVDEIGSYFTQLPSITNMAVTELQIQANQATALATVLEGVYAASGSKSKALFLIVKAAAVAEGLVRAQLAYLQVLSSPPGPLYTLPLAESVRAMALASVAAMAAVSIGQAAGMGGSGGTVRTSGFSSGGGGATGFTGFVGGGMNTDNNNPPVVNITIEGSALMDSHTLDLVLNSAVDKIGSILNDRSGRAGPIKIHTTRL